MDDHRRQVEQIVSDVGISDVAARSDGELQTSLEALSKHEQTVSDLRRRVQTVMDGLTAEIGRRYRDGEADVVGAAQPRQLMEPAGRRRGRPVRLRRGCAPRVASSRSTPTARSPSRSGLPDEPMFPRSSNKPLQAVGMLALRARPRRRAARPRRRPRTRARTSTSRASLRILAGAGLGPEALQNPTDLPYGEAARTAWLRDRAASRTGWP